MDDDWSGYGAAVRAADLLLARVAEADLGDLGDASLDVDGLGEAGTPVSMHDGGDVLPVSYEAGHGTMTLLVRRFADGGVAGLDLHRGAPNEVSVGMVPASGRSPESLVASLSLDSGTWVVVPPRLDKKSRDAWDAFSWKLSTLMVTGKAP